jgi:hypothetical protein
MKHESETTCHIQRILEWRRILNLQENQVFVIWSKWQSFKLCFLHIDLWKMFHQLQGLEYINVLYIWSTVIILYWIKYGLNYLLLCFQYYLELAFKEEKKLMLNKKTI